MKKTTKKFNTKNLDITWPTDELLDKYVEMALRVVIKETGLRHCELLATRVFNIALALVRADRELYEELLED